MRRRVQLKEESRVVERDKITGKVRVRPSRRARGVDQTSGDLLGREGVKGRSRVSSVAQLYSSIVSQMKSL